MLEWIGHKGEGVREQAWRRAQVRSVCTACHAKVFNFKSKGCRVIELK